MIWLRSMLFQVGMWLSVALFAILSLTTLPLPFRARYAFLSQWGRFSVWWLALTCNLRFRVEGRENIPAETCIVLAKHQSAWETFAMQQVFPPQTWVLKRELLWIPFFGWALAMLSPIAIDRKAGRKALEQLLTQATERLRRGIWVVIFPEGTRTAPGTRGKYNIGGAKLAEKSGYPVVPVAHNAGEFWPKHGFLKRPGTITLVVGPKIDSKGRKATEINAEAEAWIEARMVEISTL